MIKIFYMKLSLIFIICFLNCMKNFNQLNANFSEKGIFILIDARDLNHIVGKFHPFRFILYGKENNSLHSIKSNFTLLYLDEQVDELNFLFDYGSVEPFVGSKIFNTQNKNKIDTGNPYWYSDLIVKYVFPKETKFDNSEIVLLKLKETFNLYKEPKSIQIIVTILTFGMNYLIGAAPTQFKRIDVDPKVLKLDFKKSNSKNKEFKIETINDKKLTFDCDKEIQVSDFLDVINVDNIPFAKVYVYEKTRNKCYGEVIYSPEARVFVGDRLIQND